jgi:hypothetical protein
MGNTVIYAVGFIVCHSLGIYAVALLLFPAAMAVSPMAAAARSWSPAA